MDEYEFESLLTRCKNCRQVYSCRSHESKRVPLILSCGCTFCNGCLAQLARDGQITCTHCRGKTFVSASHTLGLPPNYYVLGRLVAKELKLPRLPVEAFGQLQSLTSAHIQSSGSVDIGHSTTQLKKCEECGAVATSNCLQCDGHYCSPCFQTIHMSSVSMRRHKAVPITQMYDGPSHCISHMTHLIEYYCTDDATSCCSECCITGAHKGHSIVSLTEMAESQRQKLIPLITEAKNGARVLKAASEDINDRIKAYRKEVHRELVRLEKQFSRSYSLLQLHQQLLTDKYCSRVVNSVSLVRNKQAKLHTQMQALAAVIQKSQEAVDNDFILLKEAPSIIDHLRSIDMATDIVGESDDLCPPVVRLNLSGFKEYLVECLATITANGAVKSDLDISDISINVSGIATPAHPAATPLSSRPTSAMSESYMNLSSSAGVQSERGSKASSLRGVSPAPSKLHSHLEDVNSDETIEVKVSHIVSIDEFYVQSCDQLHRVKEMSDILSSSSPPLKQLDVDSLREGMHCVGVCPSDGLRYRVLLCSISTADLPHASAKFVDTGKIQDLSITNLYALPPTLLNEPSLCIQCYLHAIHPPTVRYQHHATPTLWSTNANRMFTELVLDKVFNMKVYRQRSSGVLSVDLLTFDGHGSNNGEVEECSSIICQLIDRKVAVLDNRKWVEPHSLSVSLGKGDCLDVTVPTAENPWDFYVHLASGRADLEKIADVLCHKEGRLKRSTLPPFKNMLCCCRFTEDHHWYRAQVKGVKGESVEVMYIDFGNTETVGKMDIHLLPDEALKCPFQAVHCSLSDIQPIRSQKKWSEDVSDRFNELVGHPVYQMVVKEIGTPLSVELVDKTTNKSLSALLVEHNMAEYTLQSHCPSPLVSMAVNLQPSTILPPELPCVGDTLRAKVVHVQSLAHFFIQRTDQTILVELGRLKSIKARKTADGIKPGTAGLARFPGDEGYHRVTVLSSSPQGVKVYYVDFGNCLELPAGEVVPLPREMIDTPALGIPCSLVGGAKDCSQMLPIFSELVVDKVLSITVKGVSSGPPSVLLVSLVDEEGFDIERQLTDMFTTPENTVEADYTSSSDHESVVSSAALKKEIVICVTFVSEEGIVYGHDITNGAPTAESLRLIEDALIGFSQTPSPMSSLDPLSAGENVCARSLEDGVLYRATIKEIKEDKVTVYYIDYGNTETLPTANVIPEALLPELPPQAVGLKFTKDAPPTDDVIDKNITAVITGRVGDLYLATAGEAW